MRPGAAVPVDHSRFAPPPCSAQQRHPKGRRYPVLKDQHMFIMVSTIQGGGLLQVEMCAAAERTQPAKTSP